MLSFYFSPYGRINRKDFWLKFILVLIGISFVTGLADYILFPASREQSDGPIAMVANVALFWPQIALTTKRFHDRDMSGWWQILFNLVIAAGGFFAYSALLEFQGLGEMVDSLWTPLLVGGGVALVAGLAEMVILGFLPGTKGRNKYGDDPLSPSTGQVAEVFS